MRSKELEININNQQIITKSISYHLSWFEKALNRKATLQAYETEWSK